MLPAIRPSLPRYEELGRLREQSGVSGVLYQGSDAAEESFKALTGARYGLIHIATHGYFLADLELRHDDTGQPGGAGQTQKPRDNPLLRSMLMFSGANHAWSGGPVEGVEDGILTADEIAHLNLLRTKLVILSACQTGLGGCQQRRGSVRPPAGLQTCRGRNPGYEPVGGG